MLGDGGCGGGARDSVFARALRRAGLCLAASIAFAGSARAGDFYKGKTITILVGFSQGGGFDAYDRALANRLGDHLKGRPRVVVLNMPGAGSLTVVQAMIATEPTDGTVLGAFNPGLIERSIVEPARVRANVQDLAWIGRFTPEFRVCYGFGPDGVRTWADLMSRKEFVLGTSAKGDGAYIDGALLHAAFKAPIKEILGFPGSAEQRRAIERGELDGGCGAFSSIPEAWLKSGSAHVFVRFDRERAPGMPAEARYIGNFATNESQRELIDFVDSDDEIGRSVAVSGKVPPDRLAQLRKAFVATMRDPAFRAEAAKEGLPIYPGRAEEVQDVIQKMERTPRETLAMAKKIFE